MGCVYILKNPAMPDLIKIGHTKRTARERANELYTTGVPEPFEVAYEFPCEDHERLEREIHKKLADHRNNPEREFFRYVVKVNVGKSTEFAYQDQLTIIVPDQPTVPPIPLKIMMNLTIEDPGDYKSVSAIHEDLKKTRDALPSELSKLYEFVQEHKQTGSDIWDWFQYEAVDYLSAAHQNLIICLSDGYLTDRISSLLLNARNLPQGEKVTVSIQAFFTLK